MILLHGIYGYLSTAYTIGTCANVYCQHLLLNKDADLSRQLYRLTCDFIVCKYIRDFH